MTRYFVGITGASGQPYGARLVRVLLELGCEVDVSWTDAGRKVFAHELGVEVDPGRPEESLRARLAGDAPGRLRVFPPEAVEAPPSSGTSGTAAVILCPCSMGTLARVTAGFSSNLVERAADVALKEGRQLVLVPRETPLSKVHLENLLRAAELGAVVLPAMPGFYHRPESLQDLVDHVVGKILDRLGLEHEGIRWDGRLEGEPPAEPGIERAS